MSFSGTSSIEDYVAWGANYGPLTAEGQWWRLVTAMFIHIGPVHLIVNMIALRNLGLAVEPWLGRPGYTLLYFVTGIGASLTSVIWHPQIVSAGASGAIFGLFGGLIGLLLRDYVVSGRRLEPRLVRSLVLNILINLGISLLPGIDMAAHMGGFALGTIFGFLWRGRKYPLT